MNSPLRNHRSKLGWRLVGLFAVGLLIFSGVQWILATRKSANTIRNQFQDSQSTGHSTFELPDSTKLTPVDRQINNLAPDQAGWTSESLSSAITKQLSRLTATLKKGNANLPEIAAEGFTGTLIDDAALVTTIDSAPLVARRLLDESAQFTPTDSLIQQLESLLGASINHGQRRCKFKVAGIEMGADQVTVDLLFESAHATDDGIEQTNATCESIWDWSADATASVETVEPKLRSLKIQKLERSALSAAGKYLFEDATGSVLPMETADEENVVNQQFLRDTGHWSERLSKIDDTSLFGHHGIAVADVNGDGLEDLYVCDAGGLPNRLYLQQSDGTLRDASQSSKANWLESSSGALLVNIDDDSDPDLVVATVAGVIIAENNGKGVFRIRQAIPSMTEAYSLAAADFDNDRDLDIYVAVYGPGGSTDRARGFEAASPIPYHDANNGGANVLLQNNGNFSFENATQQTGLDANNRRFSFAASWEDFDVDGDMDIYVANDFGRNNLYVNDGGKFRDIAAEAGVEDRASGMSVSWGDANQDGHMDIYVGNMYSAAGNRVTYQRQFLGGRSADSSARIQRMARGNTLFMSQGAGASETGSPKAGGFTDISEPAGVLVGRWAWSSKFTDINNDGRQDLVVANGYFTNTRPNDL